MATLTLEEVQLRYPHLIDYEDPDEGEALIFTIDDIVDELPKSVWGDGLFYLKGGAALAAHRTARSQMAAASSAGMPVKDARAGEVSTSFDTAFLATVPADQQELYTTTYGVDYVRLVGQCVPGARIV